MKPAFYNRTWVEEFATDLSTRVLNVLCYFEDPKAVTGKAYLRQRGGGRLGLRQVQRAFAKRGYDLSMEGVRVTSADKLHDMFDAERKRRLYLQKECDDLRQALYNCQHTDRAVDLEKALIERARTDAAVLGMVKAADVLFREVVKESERKRLAALFQGLADWRGCDVVDLKTYRSLA